jgi:paraquat-inducible protein A
VTACLIFLLMANVRPLMVFDVSGNTQSNLMITGVESLFSQGYWPLALLVFFSAIGLPILYFAAFWYLLAGCCLRLSWPGLKIALILVETLLPWNLMPVFAVGTLAAVVKLEQLGNIHWKSGSLWVGLLAIVSLIVMRFFDRSFFEKIITNLNIS